MKARSLGVLAHDLVAAGVAWSAAFWLRFNLDVPPDFAAVLRSLLPWVVTIHGVVFVLMGLYRGLWRYASLPDLRRIFIAIGLSALTVPALFALLRMDESIPR